MVRSIFADYLTDSPAPLGFAIQAPSGKTSLHVVVDRSGFILGRARDITDSVAVLASHLAALMPPPNGTVRLRARAFLRDDNTAVLAGFPLFTDPPVVERRLKRESCRVIDRLAVDLGSDGFLGFSPAPWNAKEDPYPIVGHATAPTEPIAVARLLQPQVSSTALTEAAKVAFVASISSSAMTRADRLTTSEQLVSRFEVVGLRVDDRSARYEMLRG